MSNPERDDAAPSRDAQGRFAPLAPANAFGRKVAALREAFVDAVSADDLRMIAVKLVQSAQEGKISAAKLLLQYCLGKPTPCANPDSQDQEEWNQRMARPTPDELEAGTKARPPLVVGVGYGRALDEKCRVEMVEQLDPAGKADFHRTKEEGALPDVARGCPPPQSHGTDVPGAAPACRKDP